MLSVYVDDTSLSSSDKEGLLVDPKNKLASEFLNQGLESLGIFFKSGCRI